MSSEEVDRYLVALDEPKRLTLTRPRATILSIVPEAEEGLAYRRPHTGFAIRRSRCSGLQDAPELPTAQRICAQRARRRGLRLQDLERRLAVRRRRSIARRIGTHAHRGAADAGELQRRVTPLVTTRRARKSVTPAQPSSGRETGTTATGRKGGPVPSVDLGVHGIASKVEVWMSGATLVDVRSRGPLSAWWRSDRWSLRLPGPVAIGSACGEDGSCGSWGVQHCGVDLGAVVGVAVHLVVLGVGDSVETVGPTALAFARRPRAEPAHPPSARRARRDAATMTASQIRRRALRRRSR